MDAGDFGMAFFVSAAGVGAAMAWHSGGSVPVGLAIGGAVGLSPFLLLGIGYAVLMVIAPDRPPCSCGSCVSGDYVFVDMTIGPNGRPTAFSYRCPACGTSYLQRDGRYLRIRSDGSTEPYMEVSHWGRWIASRS